MLRLRLGRVLVDNLQQIDDALEAYRAVYEADGENAEAIGALERLYRQTSRFADLLGIYEKKRDLSTTTDEKKAINYEIAKLYENEIKDVDKAIETYVQVLEDEPTDAHALAALDVLYGRLGRWEPYVDVLRRRIELDVGEARAHRSEVPPRADAREAPRRRRRRARELPRDPLPRSAARGRAHARSRPCSRATSQAEAAAILESIYEERGDWPKLIDALEILSASQDDVEKRVALKRKAARISAERVNDFKHAFAVLASALARRPVARRRRATRSSASRRRRARSASSWRSTASSPTSLTDAALARDYWMRIAGHRRPPRGRR